MRAAAATVATSFDPTDFIITVTSTTLPTLNTLFDDDVEVAIRPAAAAGLRIAGEQTKTIVTWTIEGRSRSHLAGLVDTRPRRGEASAATAIHAPFDRRPARRCGIVIFASVSGLDAGPERYGLIDARLQRRRGETHGTLGRRHGGTESDLRRRSSVGRLLERRDLPLGTDVPGNRQFLSTIDEGPCQGLVAEVRRNLDREHAHLTARQEVRGLPLVGRPWLKHVVGPDRNIDRCFEVAVEIAEHQTERAILVLEPAVERRCHRLSDS